MTEVGAGVFAEYHERATISRWDVLKLASAGLSTASAAFPKAAVIRTVLQDMPPESLGTGATLFHEHLSLAPDFMPRWIASVRGGRASVPQPSPPAQPHFMQDVDLMSAEMSAAAKDGVACIVDQGHADMGRDLETLKRISRQSGLPIVAACGYYTQPFYPPENRRLE